MSFAQPKVIPAAYLNMIIGAVHFPCQVFVCSFILYHAAPWSNLVETNTVSGDFLPVSMALLCEGGISVATSTR